jgi:hypothetical protein
MHWDFPSLLLFRAGQYKCDMSVNTDRIPFSLNMMIIIVKTAGKANKHKVKKGKEKEKEKKIMSAKKEATFSWTNLYEKGNPLFFFFFKNKNF